MNIRGWTLKVSKLEFRRTKQNVILNSFALWEKGLMFVNY